MIVISEYRPAGPQSSFSSLGERDSVPVDAVSALLPGSSAVGFTKADEGV